MNYIISGGLGFIGKNLSVALARSHEDFVVLDKLTGCDLNTCDIRMAECNKFVHLAACTNIRESLTCPEKFIIENVQTTVRCLNYARQTGAHFIFASSLGAPQALSPYSASKLACEAICKAYHESFGVKVTILRFSSVYGPYSMHKSSVIASFIKNCLKHSSLTINGDGVQERDFIYVDDVVKAIVNCGSNKVMNVCTGFSTSINYLAEYIRDLSDELINFRPEIKFSPAIKGEVMETPAKPDILAETHLEKGIKETFKWYMEHYKC